MSGMSGWIRASLSAKGTSLVPWLAKRLSTRWRSWNLRMRVVVAIGPNPISLGIVAMIVVMSAVMGMMMSIIVDMNIDLLPFPARHGSDRGSGSAVFAAV